MCQIFIIYSSADRAAINTAGNCGKLWSYLGIYTGVEHLYHMTVVFNFLKRDFSVYIKSSQYEM